MYFFVMTTIKLYFIFYHIKIVYDSIVIRILYMYIALSGYSKHFT